jgi:hypothetical protein
VKGVFVIINLIKVRRSLKTKKQIKKSVCFNFGLHFKNKRMKKIVLSLFAIALVGFNAKAQIIKTVAGNGTGGYTGDGGQATAAELNEPADVDFDAAGNLYIADFSNNLIRKITTAGVISTFAGTGASNYTGDGGQATAATLNGPNGVAVDAAGNVYIADQVNNRIRKVTTAGIISTVAGNNGAGGYSGDGGQATAAALNEPTEVAVDAAGNVYIADSKNNRIRKVTTAGVISNYAGNGTASYAGDGAQATAAEINFPQGVEVDASGNVYIADTENNRIRKVTTAGVISTVAGNGTAGYAGDGAQATAAALSFPLAVALDAAGNLYIIDAGNVLIRKVTKAGVISTYAGNGTSNYTGDGGPATAAGLSSPNGVGVSAAGNLYIADTGNNAIRVVTSPAPGAALNFDGVDDYVLVPDNAALNFGTGDFTIEADFQSSTNQTNYAGLVVKANSSGIGGYQLVITNNVITAEFSDNTNFYGYAQGLHGSIALNDGTWHHLAMVVSRSTNNISLYVDGNLDGGITNNVINTTNVSYAAPMLMGVDRIYNNHLNGNEDEVRIWNRALCQGEIQNNMNAELKLPQTGLVAYYKFNQGIAAGTNTTVTTAADSSGNGNNGTLTNFTLTGATSNWISPGAVTTGSLAPAFSFPVISVNSYTNAVCAGTPVTYTATGDAGNTYQWSASSATTNTVVVTPTGTTAIVYSVVSTNSVGCVSNTATTTLSVNASPIITVNSGSVCAGNSFTLSPGGATANSYTYSSGSAVVTPTTTTNYTVSGTDANNCVGMASNTVTLNALPTITVNSGTVCVGASYTITPGGATTYTYSSGSAIVTPTAAVTDYTVSGTDGHGCVNTATVEVDAQTCSTGMDGLTNTMQVMVYPNPSNGSFTIASSNVPENTTLVIYNSIGQVVYTQQLSKAVETVNTNLDNGMYTIKLQNTQGISTQHIIIAQ